MQFECMLYVCNVENMLGRPHAPRCAMGREDRREWLYLHASGPAHNSEAYF